MHHHHYRHLSQVLHAFRVLWPEGIETTEHGATVSEGDAGDSGGAAASTRHEEKDGLSSARSSSR